MNSVNLYCFSLMHIQVLFKVHFVVLNFTYLKIYFGCLVFFVVYKLCSFGRLISPSRPQSLQKPKDSHDTRQCAVVQLLGHVQLFATLWTIARQDHLFMGFFQERILEWVAISFSRGSSQPRDRTHVFCISCIDRWILYH